MQTSKRNVDAYEHLKVRFNRYRNILKHSIKDAKRIYFQNIFARFKHKSKELGPLSMNRCIVKRKLSLHAYFITMGKP